MKTIKDIAKEAEVSTGTVDRVIHNRPGVSEKTRGKIEKLLKKYDFQKNLLASSLASKKKCVIATLIPFAKSKNGFWHEPNRGLKTAINEIKKYGCEVHRFYFNKFELQSYLKAFEEIIELCPNGVLLAPFFYKPSIDMVKRLRLKKIPFVFINIDIESLEKLAFIGQDSSMGGYLSGKLMHLILNQRERVLILKSKNNSNNHHIDYRIKGFVNYFKKRGISNQIEEVNINSFKKEDIDTVLSTMLIKQKEIGGIFVPSSSAFKIADYVGEINVKRKIRILGFDAHTNNLERLNNETIDFLIDQNPFEQGYWGLKILFDFLFFDMVPNKIYNSPINILAKENASYFRDREGYTVLN